MGKGLMYTAQEVREIAVAAAMEAVERFAAAHPLPTSVTADEAARMLGVSKSTVIRLRLPRNKVGRIPYEAVLDARSAK